MAIEAHGAGLNAEAVVPLSVPSPPPSPRHQIGPGGGQPPSPPPRRPRRGGGEPPSPPPKKPSWAASVAEAVARSPPEVRPQHTPDSVGPSPQRRSFGSGSDGGSARGSRVLGASAMSGVRYPPSTGRERLQESVEASMQRAKDLQRLLNLVQQGEAKPLAHSTSDSTCSLVQSSLGSSSSAQQLSTVCGSSCALPFPMGDSSSSPSGHELLPSPLIKSGGKPLTAKTSDSKRGSLRQSDDSCDVRQPLTINGALQTLAKQSCQEPLDPVHQGEVARFSPVRSESASSLWPPSLMSSSSVQVLTSSEACQHGGSYEEQGHPPPMLGPSTSSRSSGAVHCVTTSTHRRRTPPQPPMQPQQELLPCASELLPVPAPWHDCNSTNDSGNEEDETWMNQIERAFQPRLQQAESQRRHAEAKLSRLKRQLKLADMERGRFEKQLLAELTDAQSELQSVEKRSSLRLRSLRGNTERVEAALVTLRSECAADEKRAEEQQSSVDGGEEALAHLHSRCTQVRGEACDSKARAQQLRDEHFAMQEQLTVRLSEVYAESQDIARLRRANALSEGLLEAGMAWQPSGLDEKAGGSSSSTAPAFPALPAKSCAVAGPTDDFVEAAAACQSMSASLRAVRSEASAIEANCIRAKADLAKATSELHGFQEAMCLSARAASASVAQELKLLNTEVAQARAKFAEIAEQKRSPGPSPKPSARSLDGTMRAAAAALHMELEQHRKIMTYLCQRTLATARAPQSVPSAARRQEPTCQQPTSANKSGATPSLVAEHLDKERQSLEREHKEKMAAVAATTSAVRSAYESQKASLQRSRNTCEAAEAELREAFLACYPAQRLADELSEERARLEELAASDTTKAFGVEFMEPDADRRDTQLPRMVLELPCAGAGDEATAVPTPGRHNASAPPLTGVSAYFIGTARPGTARGDGTAHSSQAGDATACGQILRVHSWASPETPATPATPHSAEPFEQDMPSSAAAQLTLVDGRDVRCLASTCKHADDVPHESDIQSFTMVSAQQRGSAQTVVEACASPREATCNEALRAPCPVYILETSSRQPEELLASLYRQSEQQRVTLGKHVAEVNAVCDEEAQVLHRLESAASEASNRVCEATEQVAAEQRAIAGVLEFGLQKRSAMEQELRRRLHCLQQEAQVRQQQELQGHLAQLGLGGVGIDPLVAHLSGVIENTHDFLTAQRGEFDSVLREIQELRLRLLEALAISDYAGTETQEGSPSNEQEDMACLAAAVSAAKEAADTVHSADAQRQVVDAHLARLVRLRESVAELTPPAGGDDCLAEPMAGDPASAPVSAASASQTDVWPQLILNSSSDRGSESLASAAAVSWAPRQHHRRWCSGLPHQSWSGRGHLDCRRPPTIVEESPRCISPTSPT